jgi:hypothetical protein
MAHVREGEMAGFQFDEKGMADLQKQLEEKVKAVEIEANEAAAREPTPEAKASAFARVLRQYGFDNVDEADLRDRFTS